MCLFACFVFFFLLRGVWLGTVWCCWINLSVPFPSLSPMLSLRTCHTVTDHTVKHHTVFEKLSGLPWDAVWNTAGCGILQGACLVCSLGLLRLLEQRKGMHIRRTQLFAVPFHSLMLFQRDGTSHHPWRLPKLSFLVCWYQGSLMVRASAWSRMVGLSV